MSRNEGGVPERRRSEEWQRIWFVITWKKDPQTGRAPLYLVEEWVEQTTFFILHMYIAHKFQVILNRMRVQRNGWRVIEDLHAKIPRAQILVLYYSLVDRNEFEVNFLPLSSDESNRTINSEG